MRLILLLAVIALGTDVYNGSYTQAAWREASAQVERLLHEADAKVSDAGRKT